MKKIVFSICFVFSITIVHAQGMLSSEASGPGSLQEQFNRLKRQSSSYQEFNRPYKVVEVRKLDQFWESVEATLKAQERNLLKSGKTTAEELEKAKATIAEQEAQIAALKQENIAKTKEAEENAYAVSTISVLGVGVNKQFFLIFSTALIALLALGTAFMASLYKKSKVVTDKKINAFQEIDNEFNEYKKTARERELKLKRELQTELNSKEEMKQQLASMQKLTL